LEGGEKFCYIFSLEGFLLQTNRLPYDCFSATGLQLL
jgi:hypothetical protein